VREGKNKQSNPLPRLPLAPPPCTLQTAYGEADARHLARALVASVAHLHARGVVHRNLTPENLRLRSPGSDTDFAVAGFSVAARTEDARAETGLLGTADYVAPEVKRERLLRSRFLLLLAFPASERLVRPRTPKSTPAPRTRKVARRPETPPGAHPPTLLARGRRLGVRRHPLHLAGRLPAVL
jgi:serine/threonine protein kinase